MNEENLSSRQPLDYVDMKRKEKNKNERILNFYSTVYYQNQRSVEFIIA